MAFVYERFYIMNDKLQRIIEFCVQMVLMIPPISLVMLLVGPASSLHRVPYFSISVLTVLMIMYWFISWPKKAKNSWFFASGHCLVLMVQLGTFFLVTYAMRWIITRSTLDNPFFSCSPLVLLCYSLSIYTFAPLINRTRGLAKKIVSLFIKN